MLVDELTTTRCNWTASVDYETDRNIQDTIAYEFKDRTILCIAREWCTSNCPELNRLNLILGRPITDDYILWPNMCAWCWTDCRMCPLCLWALCIINSFTGIWHPRTFVREPEWDFPRNVWAFIDHTGWYQTGCQKRTRLEIRIRDGLGTWD